MKNTIKLLFLTGIVLTTVSKILSQYLELSPDSITQEDLNELGNKVKE